MAESSGNNIGNLEGKVVIDVAEALGSLETLLTSLTTLNDKINSMAKAREIGPTIRNLDKLVAAANAMEKLQSGGKPSPAAQAAAGGSSVSGQSSVKLVAENEEEIGKKIAGSVIKALEAQTITLSVNLKINNLEELQKTGLGVNVHTMARHDDDLPDRTSLNAVTRANLVANKDIADALKNIDSNQRGRKSETSEAATLRRTLGGFVESINSGNWDKELGGPVRINTGNTGDELAQVFSLFFDRANDVLRKGGHPGDRTAPLSDISSWAGRAGEDFDEMLDDVRRAVVGPMVAAARRSGDPSNLFIRTSGQVREELPVSAATTGGTRGAHQAAVEQIAARAAQRRSEYEIPEVSRSVAQGESTSPTRIVSAESAKAETARREAEYRDIIMKNVSGKGFHNRDDMFKMLDDYAASDPMNSADRSKRQDRSIREMPSVGESDIISGLRQLPYVGAPKTSPEYTEWQAKRYRLQNAIDAAESGDFERTITRNGRTTTVPLVDPDTRQAITPDNRDKSVASLKKRVASLKKQIEQLGRKPDQYSGFMDEADVAAALNAQGVGPGFKTAPLGISQLAGLAQLISRGTFSNVGRLDNGQYFMPQNAADLAMLQSVGYGKRAVIGEQTVERLSPQAMLRDYMTHLVSQQVEREIAANQNRRAPTWSSPEVARLAKLGADDERADEIDSLVGRMFTKAQDVPNIASRLLESAKYEPFSEQRNSGNYSPGESLQRTAHKTLRLRAMDAAIERLSSSEADELPTDDEFDLLRPNATRAETNRFKSIRTGPRRQRQMFRAAFLDEMRTARQALIDQGADDPVEAMRPVDSPLGDLTSIIRREMGETQRGLISEGFGRGEGPDGGLADQIAERKRLVQEAIVEEVRQRISSGELLDPNDYSAARLQELQTPDMEGGLTLGRRAAQMTEEGKAFFSEYAKQQFGKDADRRRAYMNEVTSRLSFGSATAAPGPARAAQKPGGSESVRPRGPWERVSKFPDTDVNQAETRTGGRFRKGEINLPTGTTARLEQQELRDKILNGFEDIMDRIPMDIALSGRAPEESNAARRGRRTQGHLGAKMGEVAEARLTTTKDGKKRRLTEAEEQTAFGDRYAALEAMVAQYRERQETQTQARQIIERSGLTGESSQSDVAGFKARLGRRRGVSNMVKREVLELLGEQTSTSRPADGPVVGRMPGHIDEPIIKLQNRKQYNTGEDVRAIYSKMAPFQNWGLGEGANGSGPLKMVGMSAQQAVNAGLAEQSNPAIGSSFANDQVVRVFVTNWPSHDSYSRPDPSSTGGGGRRRPPSRKPVASNDGGGNGRGPSEPVLTPGALEYALPYNVPKLQMLDPDFRESRSPRLSALEKQKREEERAASRAERDQERETARADSQRRRALWTVQYRRTAPGRPMSDAPAFSLNPGSMEAQSDGATRRRQTREYERLWDRLERQNYRSDRPMTSAEEIAQGQRERTMNIARPPSNDYFDARVEEQLARQRMQPRSLTTSAVSIVESLAPNRKETLRAQMMMGDSARRLEKLYDSRVNQINERASAREVFRRTMREARDFKSQNPQEPLPEELKKSIADSVATVRGFSRSISDTESIIKDVQGEFDVAKDGATNLGSVFANLAAGAVGGVGGFVLGTAVATIGSALTKVAIAAVGPAIERMMGNPGTAARVQEQLGTATAQSGGYARQAVSGQLAATGIGPKTGTLISPALESRAIGVAAGQQTSAQLDLIRSSNRYEEENRKFNGFDRSLFATTGGVLGTNFFGQASPTEQLADVMAPLGTSEINRRIANADPTVRNYARPINPQALEDAEEALSGFVEQVNRGESGLKLMADASQKGSEANEALAKDAERYGVEGAKMAAIIRATGMTASGYKGSSPYGEVMATYADNATKLPASFLARSMEGQLKSQRYASLARNQFQTGTVIPQQWAMQQAFNPFVGSDYSATATIEAMGQGTGFSANARTLGRLSRASGQITRQRDAGMDEAITFAQDHLPVAEAKQFADNLQNAADIGNQIANLRMDTQIKQAELGAKQFKESMRQAKIAAQDALGMAGKSSNPAYNAEGSAGNLGALQRSDFYLGQQSARLSQGLTQRQINFQTAMAGFSAPGMTPEERAARQEQAKIEADYAQKQLDIQKKMTENQAKEFQISSARNVTITARQVELMGQGQQTALDAAANDATIQGLTQLLQKPVEIVQSAYSTAAEEVTTKISTISGIIANTSDSFQEVTKAVSDMLPAVNDWAAALGIDVNSKDGKSQQPVAPVRDVKVSVVFNNTKIGSSEDARALAEEVARIMARTAAQAGMTRP